MKYTIKDIKDTDNDDNSKDINLLHKNIKFNTLTINYNFDNSNQKGRRIY